MVALAIVLDVAFHSSSETVVNAAELAERTGMARRTLEPLLQALSRERLLDSTRGPHGGYRLGRPARLIKVSDVITIGLHSLEESALDLSGRLQRAVVEPLWNEFDAALVAHAELADDRGPAKARGGGRAAKARQRTVEFCDLTRRCPDLAAPPRLPNPRPSSSRHRCRTVR